MVTAEISLSTVASLRRSAVNMPQVSAVEAVIGAVATAANLPLTAVRSSR